MKSPTKLDIRQRRKDAGLSQQRLAELAGCSIATVRLVENGWQASSQMLGHILAALDEEEKATP
jgi:transcriptional regulator with XRE-family HTH domain